jgi:FkbM family methyltransferase
MDYQQYLDWTYFGEGGLDAAEFERMGQLFADVDTFLDVGASHGVYTFHALQHMQRGRIIAIEADPERFAILQANVAKWLAESDSSIEVECMNAAASDDLDLAESPTVTFFTTGTQISGGLFPVDERSDEYAPIEIPLVKLDEFFVEGESVLVKIDVEGGELRVLRGAQQLIRSGRTRFFVELSWWGDRGRKTSVMTSLRFIWKAGLGIEKRLRSDYLLFSEPSGWRRSFQTARVLPALLPRYVFSTFVPSKMRTAYIRRQNEQRISSAPRVD